MPIENCAGAGSGRAVISIAAINAGSDLEIRIIAPFSERMMPSL
jgi:hypothetical protein